MTFLNATLLFAMGAVAVPIVLHLIAKREPKKVVFPSVRFLTKTFESNRAKLRVRRWWLLALRMLALAALAVALARPAIHQSLSITWLTIGLIAAVGIVLLVMATVALTRGQSKPLTYSLAVAALLALIGALGWGGYTYASGKRPPIDNDAPAAIAIMMDNSLTVGWKTADDDRLQRMKQIAHAMIARLPPTSRIAIVDRSSTPVTFSLDVASANSKVDQVRPLAVTQPVAARVDAAVRLIRTSELENRQILLVTDLARHSWDQSEIDSQLTALIQQKPEIGITVFDLGDFDSLNRTLSLPRLSDATPTKGVPIPVSTTLEVEHARNDKPVAVTAELELYAKDPTLPVIRDGVVQLPKRRGVDRKSIELPAGGSSEILLTIPPLDVGVHHGLMRLVGEDALAVDDVRHFTIEVLPPTRVLLVGDNEVEANVIAQTITAPFEVDDPSAEYVVERVGFDDLPAVQMQGFKAAILLDPNPEIVDDEALVDFVNQSGSVFVCFGASAGQDPIQLKHLPEFVRPWRSPEPFTFLNPLQTSHPILAPMSEISGGVPWGEYRVEQYWQIEPRPRDRVLMRFAGTKHPALVQSPGNSESAGSWVVMATPLPDLANPKSSWNDLFGTDAWPAFLLVRRITEVISGRGNVSWMPLTGQPQVVTLPTLATRGKPNAQSNSETESERLRLQLFPPGDAAPVPIDLSATAIQFAVNDVLQPGTYWLRGVGQGMGFSANVPAETTITERIDPSQLDAWFGKDSYSVAIDESEIELTQTGSAQRISLRSPMMLFALAVFLLELVLGNRFYRSRSTPSKQTSSSAVAA